MNIIVDDKMEEDLTFYKVMGFNKYGQICTIGYYKTRERAEQDIEEFKDMCSELEAFECQFTI